MIKYKLLKKEKNPKELLIGRKKIDKIDSQISKLLEKRLDVVKLIGEYKKKNGIKVSCKSREKIVLKNVVKNCRNIKIKKALKKIYTKIIEISKNIEK